VCPLNVIGRVRTPLAGVVTPVTHLYVRPFIGLITLLITGRGPPCGF